jgi:arylsulfatase A-like enzyme
VAAIRWNQSQDRGQRHWNLRPRHKPGRQGICFKMAAASILLSAIAAGLFASQVSAADTPRPNILYVFTDDQSFRTLSCYPGAYPFADTPNIDRLARSGVMFTQAFPGAKCVPSRAMMLTGRLQFNVGDKCDRYWAEDFRSQGYITGMIGKWHWGKGVTMHKHGTAWDWSVVWDHGQPEEHNTYYWGQSVHINGGPAEKLEGYSTDRYTDFAVNFIHQQSHSEKPWLLWLCYGAVHGPYTPADRHAGSLENGPATPIPADVFGPRPGKPEHMDMFTKWESVNGEPVTSDRSLDSWVKQYSEAVRAIDDGVGRLCEALRSSGQLENTVIVFTSDQGFAWGEHGLRDKRYPYDAALRSPLIIANPARFAEAAVCKHPINGPDIVRTLHTIAAVEPAIPLDGRDFTSLLMAPATETEWTDEPMLQSYTCSRYSSEAIEQAITEGKWEQLTFDNSPAWLMLHDGRFKYTRYLSADCIEELYDLATDPAELINLAVDPACHDTLKSYRDQATKAFLRKGATFVDKVPPPRVIP